MAVVRKFGELSRKLLLQNKPYVCAVRHYQNYDEVPIPLKRRMPGKWPKTREEHEKAADKYNMHPDEYKPFNNDDGTAPGDYPDLPLIGAEAKDPYYPWDFPQHKRNYGEPLHVDFFVMIHERFPHGVRQPIDLFLASCIFVGAVTIAVTLCFIFPKYNPPVLKKQYPGDGVVHYTFTPAH